MNFSRGNRGACVRHRYLVQPRDDVPSRVKPRYIRSLMRVDNQRTRASRLVGARAQFARERRIDATAERGIQGIERMLASVVEAQRDDAVRFGEHFGDRRFDQTYPSHPHLIELSIAQAHRFAQREQRQALGVSAQKQRLLHARRAVANDCDIAVNDLEAVADRAVANVTLLDRTLKIRQPGFDISDSGRKHDTTRSDLIRARLRFHFHAEVILRETLKIGNRARPRRPSVALRLGAQEIEELRPRDTVRISRQVMRHGN
jgi:hypothetical protein